MKAALLLPVFIFLICIAFAQDGVDANKHTNLQYKIAVYEYARSGGANWYKKHYIYQIRNLFRRVGNIWEAATDPAKTQYYLVFKGQKFANVKGLCCQPAPGYWYQELDNIKKSGRFLTAQPATILTKNYLSGPFDNSDADLIKKAVLLSNNPTFKQNTRLSAYLPGNKEMTVLLYSSKAYMAALVRGNECVTSSFSNIDTMLLYSVNNVESILIDSLNCFVDQDGNKLINILFPAGLRWDGTYPFIEDCHREAQFSYFKILCYVTAKGTISFVHDNLQYLDHGDFDNDGKDEFLFWSSMHNHDGYVLLYDDFKKNAELIWSYH